MQTDKNAKGSVKANRAAPLGQAVALDTPPAPAGAGTATEPPPVDKLAAYAMAAFQADLLRKRADKELEAKRPASFSKDGNYARVIPPHNEHDLRPRVEVRFNTADVADLVELRAWIDNLIGSGAT